MQLSTLKELDGKLNIPFTLSISALGDFILGQT